MPDLYCIRADWDPDADVWVASSEDVPGLITEAHSIEALDAKLTTLIPELLRVNTCLPRDGAIRLELLARRVSFLRV